MGLVQWLIVAAVAAGVGWIILQPQRWGKRDADGYDGGTVVGVSHDRDGADGDGGDGGGD